MYADVHKREAQTLKSGTSTLPEGQHRETTVQPANRAAALAKVRGSRWMYTM